jgi:hypothetical protein
MSYGESNLERRIWSDYRSQPADQQNIIASIAASSAAISAMVMYQNRNSACKYWNVVLYTIRSEVDCCLMRFSHTLRAWHAG